MRYVYLMVCVLLTNTVVGQVFDHPELIKKAKKKSLTAYSTITYPDSVVQYKSSYWVFNKSGLMDLEIDYTQSKSIITKYELEYKEGKLNETRKYKTKLKELEKTLYTYNKEGLLAKQTEYRDDKLIISYQYFYNSAQKLDSIIWYDKKGNEQLYEYHRYDDKGLLTEIEEKTAYGRLDGKTELYYHTDGTLKEEKLYDGFGEMYEHMSYNDKGLLIERKLIREDKTITYTYTYSGNGLLKTGKKAVSNQPQVIDFKYKWSKKLADLQK